MIFPVRERVILQKREEMSVKSFNDTLLSRLRPYRSGASSLVTLTAGSQEPSTPTQHKKELEGNATSHMI